MLKPALRLMTYYRLVIERIEDGKVISNYTRWVDAVEVRCGENQEVYFTFSPRFERIWLEAKRLLVDYVAQKPADITLRSQYALRLYSWAKKYVSVGTKRISLEQLRKVLGLESVKDVAGNVIKEAPLPVWANLRQRALDVAIAEINKKTDLNIALEVAGTIQPSTGNDVDFCDQDSNGIKRKIYRLEPTTMAGHVFDSLCRLIPYTSSILRRAKLTSLIR